MVAASGIDGVLGDAKIIGADTIVFGSDDKVFFVTDGVRCLYPFVDFNVTQTFDSVYWSAISHSVDVATMPVAPDDYLIMTRTARRVYQSLDFRKDYRERSLLCRHLRLSSGQSAQIRIDTAALPDVVALAETIPDTVSAMLAVVRELTRVAAVLNCLPVGVAVVSLSGAPVWANQSARQALEQGWLSLDDDGGLVTPAGEALSAMVRWVVDQGQVVYRSTPAAVLSISPGPSGETALLLLSARYERAAADACLRDLGLTPALSRAALDVVEFGGAAEAAAATGQNAKTLYRQLSRAFERLEPMGVSSQTGMARLVGNIAAVTVPPVAASTGVAPLSFQTRFSE